MLARAWLFTASVGSGVLGCGGGESGGGPPVVVGDGGLGGADAGLTPPKTAFVTETEVTPYFASLGDADAQCNKAASSAGLSGVFLAWLSASTASPSTRFARAEGNYVSVKGTVIANGWAGLTTGALKAAIDHSELGDEVTFATEAWTGTHADGTATTSNCNDWTGTGQATIGDVNAYGAAWTAKQSTSACAGFHHLYCFEQ